MVRLPQTSRRNRTGEGLPPLLGGRLGDLVERTGRQQRFSFQLVPQEDVAPNILGGFSIPKQLAILGIDRSFGDEEFGIEHLPPVTFADKDYRHRGDLAGLGERQYL